MDFFNETGFLSAFYGPFFGQKKFADFDHFFDMFSETFSGSELGTIFTDSGAHFHVFFEVGGARDCERRSFRETSKILVGVDQNRGPRLPAEFTM